MCIRDSVKTVAQANLKDAADSSQSRDKAVRVRTELRPDVLSIDATLIEFREWLTTFKSYFYGSNLQNDHISGQQAIYKQLLDTELRRRVAPECGADTHESEPQQPHVPHSNYGKVPQEGTPPQLETRAMALRSPG